MLVEAGSFWQVLRPCAINIIFLCIFKIDREELGFFPAVVAWLCEFRCARIRIISAVVVGTLLPLVGVFVSLGFTEASRIALAGIGFNTV